MACSAKPSTIWPGVPQRQESPQVFTHELSIGREGGKVVIDIRGTPHRVPFTPAGARRLVAEIKRGLGTGFGRDIDVIRQHRVPQ